MAFRYQYLQRYVFITHEPSGRLSGSTRIVQLQGCLEFRVEASPLTFRTVPCAPEPKAKAGGAGARQGTPAAPLAARPG